MAALLNRTDYGVLSTGPAISVTSGCSTLRLKENLKSKRSLTSTVHLPAFHVGVETQTVSESNWTQAEAVQEMVVFVILNGTSRKMLFWMAASYYGIQTLQTHIEANHLYTYINHAYYIGKRHFFKKMCISSDTGGFPALSILFCSIYEKYINPKTCFHQSLDSMNI